MISPFIKWSGCALLLVVSLVINGQPNESINQLPLRAFPTKGNPKVLFVYFTGDGGWNNFSQQLVEQLHAQHHPVVAFDSRKYFWNAKTPAQFAKDIDNLLSYYNALWKTERVAFIGYSFGADVAAFLPGQLKTPNAIISMALLSPSYSSDFEVKLSDLMGSNTKVERKYNVQDALIKSTIPILCIFGEEEELYLKKSLEKSSKIKIKNIPGAHRYDNNVELLVSLILENTSLT
jgi:type IV secretory pathway VirJ component